MPLENRAWRLSAAAVAFAGALSAPLFAWGQDYGSFEVAPPPSVTVELRPGVSQEVSLSRPYVKGEVDNPAVVDIQPETDLAATLHPGQPGSTTVRFRDEKGLIIADFLVIVGPVGFGFEDVPGRVKVYRTPRDIGFYRCSPTDCELVAEKQSTEDAPKAAPAQPPSASGDANAGGKDAGAQPKPAPPK